mmetsp:Transcript_38889/g.81347  ORF Transcript_38889/g.81347 Transcript_38889/m.81347 type:complete len:97 (-) Transcript_38889:245-535(-)|eukprot:CAMPEP_0196143236 /NCGR_PEP_ID=MMETSP0910-20130528/12944_1 /TAXON_ID=49265 /ORGANISM="Thalassiosira rotula, Strain GSO102" /LENGTH=96 /DNA_ID=CAMNT_0041404659 /DNA_START=125 /DNA_END=415 /DNA_ORIENTATION=+
MSQNESALSLLQECVVDRGGASSSDANNIPTRCRQRNNEEPSSSPVNLFMDILKTKAASMQQEYGSSPSTKTATAHSALIQDFNHSSKVWGISSWS